MPHRNNINEKTEENIWKVIADQLTNKSDEVYYTAQFFANDFCVTLDIDINPESDEEDVRPCTSFSALLPNETSFRFKIEKQGLKQEIRKLFGRQDVVVGHPEFDKKFLIQS